MPFRNSVVGGVTLVRAAIRSPNYVAGVSGWSINRDGSAEFSDVVIRGGSGPSVIIGPASGVQVVITTTGGVGQIEFPTHQPQEEIDARIAAAAVNDGAANETLVLGINGPQSSTDSLRYRMTFNTTALDSSNEGGITFNRMVGAVDTVVGGFRRVIGEACDRFFVNGRMLVQPNADNASTALFVEIPAAYAGGWMHIRKNGTTRLLYTTSGVFQLWRAASGDDTFAVFVDGDSAARFLIDAGGEVGWGSGSAATDVSIARTGVGVLQINGDLKITGNDTADAEDLTDRSVSSAVYATGTSLSVTIDLPASGVVYADTNVRGFNNTANGRIFQALLISGSVSGTLLSPIDDRSACVECNVANETGSSAWSKRINLTALGAVAGETVTFTVQNRVSAGTATIQSRNLSVFSLTS